jgi:hypothetical protein
MMDTLNSHEDVDVTLATFRRKNSRSKSLI